jgi:sulfatase modifying factor 1
MKASVFPSQSDSEQVSAISATQEKWICFDAKGQGVFAERRFARGEVIESAPVIVVPQEQLADIEQAQLTTYCCAWGGGQALALGFAHLYTHSDSPNAALIKRIEALSIEVVALRDIEAREKIVVDLNANDGFFWLAKRNATVEGAIDPDHPARGRDHRLAREKGCQEAERKAMAQAAQRSAGGERQLLQATSLVPADGAVLDLVPVPYGVFLVGGEEQDPDAFPCDTPQHKRFLDDYFIGKYPVTVRQFAAFVAATGYRTLAEQEGTGWVYSGKRWKNVRGADWRHPYGPESNAAERSDHPVTLVSWDDAVAFCNWASRVTGYKMSLPSELEWEKAARGTDGRPWPWGNEPPDPTRCNYLNSVGDTTPVGRYSPRGDSLYHCADMAGNVWEWTASYLRAYPYECDEQRGGRDGYILRGGAFHQNHRWVRCSCRYWNYYQ